MLPCFCANLGAQISKFSELHAEPQRQNVQFGTFPPLALFWSTLTEVRACSTFKNIPHLRALSVGQMIGRGFRADGLTDEHRSQKKQRERERERKEERKGPGKARLKNSKLTRRTKEEKKF